MLRFSLFGLSWTELFGYIPSLTSICISTLEAFWTGVDGNPMQRPLMSLRGSCNETFFYGNDAYLYTLLDDLTY